MPVTFLFFLFLFYQSVFCLKPLFYNQVKYPPLKDIPTVPVERDSLENGLHLFFLEDHELPIIQISVLIQTGSIYEPEERAGLAKITGQVMRTGGTVDRSGDDIDEFLEKRAAAIEVNIGLEMGEASLSVLTQDFSQVFSVFVDILRQPAFRDDKIELAKMQEISEISRRNDETDDIAIREFRKLIYGKGSVYSRHPEYATVKSIQKNDLIQFHQKFFQPRRILLGVWGDFKTPEIKQALRAAFKDWDNTLTDPLIKPLINYQYKSSINLVEKEEAIQSNIFLGHIGGRYDDPDYFALILMNRILGSGGFSSRLFKNVRSREGLAYDVFGQYTAQYDRPGIFYVGCQTKSETTLKAIRAMMHEIKRMQTEAVHEDELVLAKTSFLNSFVFNFDSRSEILKRMMTYAYYHYPLDFLQKIKTEVEKVTVADVKRVAEKRLHPEALQILVVGHSKKFDDALSAIGKVDTIDVTIPDTDKGRGAEKK